jgi:DnaK suppressor protein
MTSNHNQDAIRQRLTDMQHQFNARIERIEQERHGDPSLNQWSDSGLMYERDDEQFALKYAAEAQLQEVNQALQHLAQGHYGQCIVCQRDIESKRLDALPATPYCIDHADQLNP